MATSRKGSTTPKDLKDDSGGLVAGGGPDLSGTAMPPAGPAASSKAKARTAGNASGTGASADRQAGVTPAPKPRSRAAAKVAGVPEATGAPQAASGAASSSAEPAREHGSGPAGSTGGRVSDEERQRRIAERAYQKAQERGFAGDRQLDDWLEAEREHKESEGRQK